MGKTIQEREAKRRVTPSINFGTKTFHLKARRRSKKLGKTSLAHYVRDLIKKDLASEN